MEPDERRENFGTNHAGRRFDAHTGRSCADFMGQAGDATRPVSAHIGFAAVGIEETHAKIGG